MFFFFANTKTWRCAKQQDPDEMNGAFRSSYFSEDGDKQGEAL